MHQIQCQGIVGFIERKQTNMLKRVLPILIVTLSLLGVQLVTHPESAVALTRKEKISCFKSWNNSVFTEPKYTGENKFKNSDCYSGNKGNCTISTIRNQLDSSGNRITQHKVTCTDPRAVEAPAAPTIPPSEDPALDYKNSPCSSPTNCNLIKRYVNPILNYFLAPLAILAVIVGIIWGGIEYSMSSGDPQKAAQAKDRIRKALIGLVAFILLYSLIRWLFPQSI